MSVGSQGLGQIICHHVLCWAVLQTGLSFFHSISDKVVLNINVLGASVMFWIVGKCNGTLAVGIDGVLVADVISKLIKKAMYSDLFLESVKDGHIL